MAGKGPANTGSMVVGDRRVDEAPYHSALGSRAEQLADACDRYEHPDGSVAVQFDIFSGPLPDAFDACDVLYLEPPWRDGFALYERRTGHTGRDWLALMERAGELIVSSGLPAVVTISTWTPMPKPDRMELGRQHSLPCAYWCYGDVGELPAQDVDVVAALADRFGCVGDFFAGYGRSARIFAAHGKRWVLSDYNPHCIGYIAQEAPTWP